MARACAILGALGLVALAGCGNADPTRVLGSSEARAAELAPDILAAQLLAAMPSPPPSTVVPAPAAPAPTTVATPAPAVPASTVGPLAVGASELKLTIKGVERSYTAVVPPPTGKPRSLMIALHGVGGRGASMRSYGFETLAASTGTVLVYPDGIGGFWNDGRPGMDPTPAPAATDEVAFMSAMIDDMIGRAGVEPRRVALAGFSNGAIMAARASCDLADRVSALALVGGWGGADYAQICQPKLPLSVLVIAGTNDPIVPFNGGQVADFQGRKRGRVTPVNEFVNFWAGKCECGGVKDVSTIKAALSVTQAEGQTCQHKATVVLYRVQGGAHEWFRINGFDSTKIVWDFVSSRGFV